MPAERKMSVYKALRVVLAAMGLFVVVGPVVVVLSRRAWGYYEVDQAGVLRALKDATGLRLPHVGPAVHAATAWIDKKRYYIVRARTDAEGLESFPSSPDAVGLHCFDLGRPDHMVSEGRTAGLTWWRPEDAVEPLQGWCRGAVFTVDREDRSAPAVFIRFVVHDGAVSQLRE